MSADFRAWGATLASFFTASPSWGAPRLQPFSPPLRAENGLFIGLPFLLLAVLGGWLFWRRHRVPPTTLGPGQRRVLRALALAALGAYVAGDLITWWPSAPARLRLGLSYSVAGAVFVACAASWLVLRHRWGPGWPLRFAPGARWQRAMALTGMATFLVAHPLIFKPLSVLLPGMSRMRVSTRIFPILLVPLCCLAAAGAAEVLRRAGQHAPRRLAAAVVLLVSLADLAPISLAPYLVYLPRPDELPAVYRWIESAEDVDAILELPIYADHGELEYQYAWLSHGKPLLNGYSGLFPDDYQRLHQACAKRRAASAACLAEARRMGATHVIYHSGPLMFDRGRSRPRREPDPATGAEQVYSDPRSRVYRLLDRAPRDPG